MKGNKQIAKIGYDKTKANKQIAKLGYDRLCLRKKILIFNSFDFKIGDYFKCK